MNFENNCRFCRGPIDSLVKQARVNPKSPALRQWSYIVETEQLEKQADSPTRSAIRFECAVSL